MPSWEQGGFFVSTECIRTHNDNNLLEIEKLQRECYKQLGIGRDKTILSYDPVLDRYLFLRYQHLEKEMLYSMLRKQMDTNLRERYSVISSSYDLTIKNDKLYSVHIGTNSLEDMYRLGVEYRRNLNSPDQERESAEYTGFVHVIQPTLIERSKLEGSTVMIISPPGITAHSIYNKNFVDFLTTGTNGNVECVRYESLLSYQSYMLLSRELNENYFVGYTEEIPLDAWFLSHPIILDRKYDRMELNEFCDSHLRIGEESMPQRSMKDEDFKKSIMTDSMKSLIDTYIQQITSSNIDWNKAIKIFNAILNYGDDLYDNRHAANVIFTNLFRNVPDSVSARRVVPNVPTNIVNIYWNRNVRTVHTGCGSSKGISFRDDFFAPFEYQNSVLQFSVDTVDYKNDPNLCRCDGKEPHFHCPRCEEAIIVGQNIEKCPKCGKGKTC